MKKIIAIIICMVIMSACSTNEDEDITPTPLISTQTSSRVASLTPVKLPTTTKLQDTPTITPSQIATAKPQMEVTKQTIDIITKIPDSAQINEQPVLIKDYKDDSPSEKLFEEIHILNVNTGEQRIIAPEGLSAGGPAISPDRNWLAYVLAPGFPTVFYGEDVPNSWDNAFLIVEDLKGEEIVRIPFKQSWGSIAQWFNNELIAIRRAPVGDSISSYTVMLAINPFTGEITDLPGDPGDIYTITIPYPYQDRFGMVLYDPSLTRRVYLNNLGHLVLENMETQEKIGEYQVPVGRPPRWSPDGQQFVIDIPSKEDEYEDDELYLISRDGQQTQLTHIANTYPTIQKISNYVWSPDGSRIACFVQLYQSGSTPFTLAIVDALTGKAILTDLTADFGTKVDPTWSLDGRYLLVNVGAYDNKRVMLVNIEEGWAYQIDSNMTPVGWLILPDE